MMTSDGHDFLQSFFLLGQPHYLSPVTTKPTTETGLVLILINKGGK